MFLFIKLCTDNGPLSIHPGHIVIPNSGHTSTRHKQRWNDRLAIQWKIKSYLIFACLLASRFRFLWPNIICCKRDNVQCPWWLYWICMHIRIHCMNRIETVVLLNVWFFLTAQKKHRIRFNCDGNEARLRVANHEISMLISRNQLTLHFKWLWAVSFQHFDEPDFYHRKPSITHSYQPTIESIQSMGFMEFSILGFRMLR